MHMWQRFDLGELREDFARLHGLGLHTVRFFLGWEDFQPQPDEIDKTALLHLVELMDALADAKLEGMPTFFSGHMSGVNFLPEWTLDRSTSNGRFRTFSNGKDVPYGIGDFYTGDLLLAQQRQVRAVGERLCGHPSLYVWDLGNEFSNLREPESPQDAALWSATLTAELLDAAEKPVTGGTHGEDITRDRHLRLSSVCAPYDFATMHGYSVYSAFSRGRLDEEVVPFLYDIARGCSHKPVLFSEFGNPTCPPGTVSPFDRVPLPGEAPLASSSQTPSNAARFACLREDEMAAYGYGVLDRLQRRGALGGLWWCWADYAQELAQTPPFDRAVHELHFGIVRNDGSEKPIAEALARFANEGRSVERAGPPIVEEASYYAGLPGNVDALYERYVANHA